MDLEGYRPRCRKESDRTEGLTSFLFIKYFAQSLSSGQLFVTLCTVAHQDPLSMEFSRQDYWSGLVFPIPGALPDPEIELVFPQIPATCVSSISCTGRWILYHGAICGTLSVPQIIFNSIPSPLCSSYQIFL